MLLLILLILVLLAFGGYSFHPAVGYASYSPVVLLLVLVLVLALLGVIHL